MVRRSRGKAFSISVENAVKEGLTFRRIEETVTDVYEWMKSTDEWELKAGISREREKCYWISGMK